MYLHGHPLFVKGDINKIIECISNNYLSIKKMTAYYDKKDCQIILAGKNVVFLISMSITASKHKKFFCC